MGDWFGISIPMEYYMSDRGKVPCASIINFKFYFL
nr:MAG TPA: hypothetical protein [Caudoviricetes sp.]